jgi:hypothetical protein
MQVVNPIWGSWDGPKLFPSLVELKKMNTPSFLSLWRKEGTMDYLDLTDVELSSELKFEDF